MTFENTKVLPLSNENMYDILKKGYQEMGSLNLILSEEGIEEDFRSLSEYEKNLAESE